MLRNTRKTGLFLPFLLLLTLILSCQSNEVATKEDGVVKIDLEILLGKWQAVDNPKSVIELTQTRMYSYYDGLKLADESLMIYHNCVSKCVPKGMAQMPCLVTDGKRAENCLEILELTDKKLTYALIGQKEKVLKFQKM